MALEGTLHYLDIAHLFQVIGMSHKSGILDIAWEDRRTRMLFERGRLTGAESNRFREGIGTLLVKSGTLSEEDLERALEVQRAQGPGARRLGAILCDQFGLQSAEIEQQLRRQFEQIAYDVFSWPGGRFVFGFQEPLAAYDRFHVDPVEFILAVGIEAGFLAEEGLARQRAGRGKPHLLFLEPDALVLGRYREHWQRKGCRVACCDDAGEFLSYLRGCDDNLLAVVLCADCRLEGPAGLDGGLEVLEAVRALHPGIAAVVVGSRASWDLPARVREAGAAYLERPSPDEIRGPQGETALAVYLVALERAIALAEVHAARTQEEGP